MKELLTASRMMSMIRCSRQHYWRYEVGLRKVISAAYFAFGHAWHLAMEAYARHETYEEALGSLEAIASELNELQAATLAGLLAGYYYHYGGAEPVKSLHTEIEFKGQPIRGSDIFEAAGKIDGLGVLWDGRQALIEHKTTSEDISPQSTYWQRLRFNLQLLQYVCAARGLGWNIQHVLYDVVRKPLIAPKNVPKLDADGYKQVFDANGLRIVLKNGKPRESADIAKGYTVLTEPELLEAYALRLALDTVARPEFYFARREVPILEQDIERFERWRTIMGRNIENTRREQAGLEHPEDAWLPNLSVVNCRSCEYQGFCPEVTIDITNPPLGFQLGDPNSELTPETTTETPPETQ